MKISAKEILLRAAITLASTVFTVIVFEITIRLSDFYPIFTLQLKTLETADNFRVTLDPDILYRSQPNSGRGIDSMGFRQPPLDLNAPHQCRILFLGDSFLMSNNLPVEETVPEQIKRVLAARGTAVDQLQVINAAISGYGPDQSLLLGKELIPELQPDIVIFGLFAGNDFEDLIRNRIFSLNSEGTLVRSDSNPVTEVLPLFRLEMLFRMLLSHQHLPADEHQKIAELLFQDKTEALNRLSADEKSRRLQLMRGVLKQFTELTSSAGLPFQVILFPSIEALEARSDYLKDTDNALGNEAAAGSLLASLAVHSLDMTGVFAQQNPASFYDPKYEHLNEAGTRRTAEELVLSLASRPDLPPGCAAMIAPKRIPNTPVG